MIVRGVLKHLTSTYLHSCRPRYIQTRSCTLFIPATHFLKHSPPRLKWHLQTIHHDREVPWSRQRQATKMRSRVAGSDWGENPIHFAIKANMVKATVRHPEGRKQQVERLLSIVRDAGCEVCFIEPLRPFFAFIKPRGMNNPLESLRS